MVWLHSTAPLFLIASAVLLVSADLDTINDVTTNDTLSEIFAIPTCSADYQRMSLDKPRSVLKMSGAHAICVRPKDGAFISAFWKSSPQFVFMFDKNGVIMKMIKMPKGTTYSVGCAFTDDKLFYANTRGNKILQFSSDGAYEKDFVTGSKFLRITTRGNLLYSTIEGSKQVRAYDTNTGEVVYSFETSHENARGLAFNPKTSMYLLVTAWGSNVVEFFTYDGRRIGQKTYPEGKGYDAILVDSKHNVIVCDRGLHEVHVYNYKGKLVKRITGFSDPTGVAMGYECDSLIVADINNGIYLL